MTSAAETQVDGGGSFEAGPQWLVQQLTEFHWSYSTNHNGKVINRSKLRGRNSRSENGLDSLGAPWQVMGLVQLRRLTRP